MTAATTTATVASVRSYLLDLQARITTAIAAIDGTRFLEDAWTKAPGEALQGSGITRFWRAARSLSGPAAVFRT